jgi:glycosyltransferase involved in cell wall biosynthesis
MFIFTMFDTFYTFYFFVISHKVFKIIINNKLKVVYIIFFSHHLISPIILYSHGTYVSQPSLLTLIFRQSDNYLRYREACENWVREADSFSINLASTLTCLRYSTSNPGIWIDLTEVSSIFLNWQSSPDVEGIGLSGEWFLSIDLGLDVRSVTRLDISHNKLSRFLWLCELLYLLFE